MEILIKIKKKKIRIILLVKKEEIDQREISEERNLSEKILVEIDALLKKNKISSGKIVEIKVDSDENNNFTTTRIAQTVAKAHRLSLKDGVNSI